jgi:hypothetical protein
LAERTSAERSIEGVLAASSWEQRIHRIRLIPQNHGIAEQSGIYAAIARRQYLPYLSPDFAYVYSEAFYDPAHFERCYTDAQAATTGFTRVTPTQLAMVIAQQPHTLLVFRTITGLTKGEFAHATELYAASVGMHSLSANKVDSMERRGTATSAAQAQVAAETVCRIIDGRLFGKPPGDLRTKQAKPDTLRGWRTVRDLNRHGVPYWMLLHQRHYGGAFRQLLDATSTRRGDVIEDSVEDMLADAGILYVRTGATNQAEIAQRFEIHVAPAPDFVVYERRGDTETVRAMLECKTTNDGGTARDKAPRFKNLREECTRLGGVPLFAVLGGMGWSRVNDTLGPVVRDTDGRVFSLANLTDMLDVTPFQSLVNHQS